jgi:hypothetical protein
VDDAALQAGVERPTVERVEERLIRVIVCAAVRLSQRRMLLHEPFRGRGVDHGDVGIGCDAGDKSTRPLELLADPDDLVVHPAGSAAVRKDAAPAGLRASACRPPMPVLHHPRATRDESPCSLPPLPVIGGPAQRSKDVTRVRLRDQERLLPRAPHPVRTLVERPGPVAHHAVRRGPRVRKREPVLHLVVGVAGGHVESLGELVVVQRRTPVIDAGGDELAGPAVLPDNVGLPCDEFRCLTCLESPPGERILWLEVAVGPP